MTTRRVLVLNGPNLGMLGAREPDVYGNTTMADLERACREAGESLGLSVEVRQTDDEAELVAWLHEAANRLGTGGDQPRCLHALLVRTARCRGDADRTFDRGSPDQPGCAGELPSPLGGCRGR